jgi:hypothetical protein
VDPEYLTAYMNIGVVYDKEGKMRNHWRCTRPSVGKYQNILWAGELGIGYRRLERYDEAMVISNAPCR